MAKSQNRWTRDQLILALEFYCRTPFGKLHSRNPEIIKLAKIIGRTPGALAMKLVNFAHFDPVLQKRGIRGLSGASEADRSIWEEFRDDWASLTLQSAQLKESVAAKMPSAALPDFIAKDFQSLETESKALVKIRRVQGFFRDAVLSSYELKCAFCGFAILQMLNASHIIPWSKAETRRADPSNGLALCAFHDRAFDRGFMSLNDDLRIVLSRDARRAAKSPMQQIGLIQLEGKPISPPVRFAPDPVALAYHRSNVFKG